MTDKAIFFDRDGVLVKDPGYVHKLEDFKLYNGVIKSLKKLKEFKLFIITNQSGIGRGYYTLNDFNGFNNHLIDLLNKDDINIIKTYYCPHHPEDNCDCRKPSNKFLMEAACEYHLDINSSFVIGDHPSDIEMASKSGCKSILMLTGHGKKHFNILQEKRLTPNFIAKNIKQAVDYVLEKDILNKKLRDYQQIKKISEVLKNDKKIVVTTNGTFDILHKGHYYFLSQAKKQGDILIVGLNSDISVKMNKGPSRPINSQLIRAQNLAKLRFVDYVVIFDENTPIELLSLIKPNTHVNGEEYGIDCIEAPIVKKNGGKICLIKRIGDYSTTNILKNIN